MEGATDPEMLKDRAFFKLGLFIHDRKGAMMAFGLVSCLLMTGLITMGADWAEGFGEDDVESVTPVASFQTGSHPKTTVVDPPSVIWCTTLN